MHNLAIVTRKLTSHNRELQLEIWPNPGAGVMLFYPGTMLSPFQYRPMLHALRQAGFAVAALHLTGHGLNRHSTGFTFDDLLQNGLNAENWLRQSGYNKIAVCGHSQGGILSLAHAAASSGIVASFPITAVLPQMREAIYLTRFAALADRRQKIEALFASLARWLPRLPLPLHAYLAPGRILAGARRTVTNRHKARFSYPLHSWPACSTHTCQPRCVAPCACSVPVTMPCLPRPSFRPPLTAWRLRLKSWYGSLAVGIWRP